mmetsp:Transcript_102314/g.289778  ORF Transcript_102314/g.289778 Transcript_102314/m.289778 type:complete len:350 (+) Transcript_102314:1750-2799(+)
MPAGAEGDRERPVRGAVELCALRLPADAQAGPVPGAPDAVRRAAAAARLRPRGRGGRGRDDDAPGVQRAGGGDQDRKVLRLGDAGHAELAPQAGAHPPRVRREGAAAGGGDQPGRGGRGAAPRRLRVRGRVREGQARPDRGPGPPVQRREGSGADAGEARAGLPGGRLQRADRRRGREEDRGRAHDRGDAEPWRGAAAGPDLGAAQEDRRPDLLRQPGGRELPDSRGPDRCARQGVPHRPRVLRRGRLQGRGRVEGGVRRGDGDQVYQQRGGKGFRGEGLRGQAAGSGARRGALQQDGQVGAAGRVRDARERGASGPDRARHVASVRHRCRVIHCHHAEAGREAGDGLL